MFIKFIFRLMALPFVLSGFFGLAFFRFVSDLYYGARGPLPEPNSDDGLLSELVPWDDVMDYDDSVPDFAAMDPYSKEGPHRAAARPSYNPILAPHGRMRGRRAASALCCSSKRQEAVEGLELARGERRYRKLLRQRSKIVVLVSTTGVRPT